ncbi:MAG TPA: c-type cytochrome [Nannocystaceae bacterium]|nr:c-type cytochrome [Nannocystaceae bacterium]
MHLRALSTALFVLCLGSLSVACDKQEDAKTDAKAKVDEKKTDAKGDEKKADTADAKAEGGNAEGKSDEKAEGANAEGKSDEKADEGGAEGKADEAKADEAKADPDEKKAAPDEKKADEKKEDTKKAPKDPKPDEGKTDPAPSGIDGKDIFGKKCKSCHGATGDGKTKIGEENDIEDWTAAGWKGKWPESKIIDIVTNGKAGTKMKPFKDKLTADEIKAVSKYARTLGK